MTAILEIVIRVPLEKPLEEAPRIKTRTEEVYPEKIIIQCPFCFERFEDQKHLARHLMEFHGAKVDIAER